MFVIGTAGHVDHGKSTLVHALTGIDPDRLAEEKAREMTIELGFAWLKLPGGLEVGVIDVPGHEHFIKNMLAGVSSMDLVLLVIAANESIKQQTREHLAILDLMQVPKAVVVITQSDLVDQDQITLVGMEIEELVQSTRFAHAPVVAVSSVTGLGLSELKATIERELNLSSPRRDIGKPRLPIDRVFTILGSGTVVTGTLIDGALTVDQEVEILPSGNKSRVRGLQTHKTHLHSVTPGSRVAINLAGISPSEIKRGDVLTSPGWLQPTTILDAGFRLLPQLNRSLRHNTEVSFHTGSAEVIARIRLLEKEEIKPGETTWVQFVFDSPLAAVNNDHYVVRSPNDTLGGGVILEVHPEKRYQRFRPEIIENLKTRGEGKTEEIILGALKTKQSLEREKLLALNNMEPKIMQAAIDNLIQQGRLVSVGAAVNSLIFTDLAWGQLVDNIVAIVTDFHRKYPLRIGIPKAEVGNKIKLGSWSAEVLNKLITEKLLVERLGLISLSNYQIQLTAKQQNQIDTYLNELAQNPFSPAPNMVLEPDLLNLLVEKGLVVKTTAGVTFLTSAYETMTAKVMALIKQNGKVTLAEARDMFQNSRKFTQALLDHMDEKKLTRRVGDDRIAGTKG